MSSFPTRQYAYARKGALQDAAPPSLAAGSLYRFIMGRDAAPVLLAPSELAATLRDPFAQRVLAAGARPVPIARELVRDVSYSGEAGGSLPFRLRHAPVPPGRRASLRVLVDLDGDGRLGAGDYRQAASTPAPDGPHGVLIVPLRRVR